MDDEEKLDVGWLVKHKLDDLDTARTQRLAALAAANAAAQEAKRVKREGEQHERDERLRAILVKHPTRWCCSIDRKMIAPGKKSGIFLPCSKCGTELGRVLEDLCVVMERTYPRFWDGDFSNSDGRCLPVVSSLACPKCNEPHQYRCLAIPY